MKKILKHGNVQPRKFICSRCGCVFIADLTEYDVSLAITHGNCKYSAWCPDCDYYLFNINAPLYIQEPDNTLNDKLDHIIDNFLDYLNEEVHPNCDYYIYTYLDRILSDLIKWQEEYRK